MRILLRIFAIGAACTGVIMYIIRAIFVHKRSVGSEVAEDLIRIVNFDLKDVDEEMLDHNVEENQKEHMIPKSIVTADIKNYEVAGMKVFKMTPQNETSAQKVLYLHGGGYIHQPSVFHWRFLSKMVRETGMEFIVPIYPKTPEYTYKDAYEAVGELYRNIIEDDDNIVLMGDSAGGGLVLGLTQWMKVEGLPMPKAQIVISPWLDITLSNPEIEHYDEVDPMLKPDDLKIIGRIWTGDAEPSYYKVSPMYGELTALPKVFLFVGTREICLPDSRKYVELLKAAGADYEYFEYPMMNHVFPLYPIKEGIEARKQIKDILVELDK